jgi:D-3-phosphoglycerate dehydrogenase / 2-oxoglutarate reductase
MTSALSDAINRWTGRWTTPVNARIVANELGIKLATLTGANDPDVEPSFSFEVLGETSHHVRVMWDRKSAGIVEVDRFALDRALAGDLLITHHRDVPGIVGRVGTIMGLYKVNIAGMQVGRHHRGGEALMVLNVDDEIPQAALDEIKTIPGVETAYRVSLPRAQPRLATVAMSTSVAK